VTERTTANDERRPLTAQEAVRMREAALREILDVISRSHDDEKPVLDAILENALQLCDAPLAFIFLANAERTFLEIVAAKGARPEFLELMQNDPTPLDPQLAISAKAVLDLSVAQSVNLASGKLWEERQRHRVYAVETEGIRSALFVPLIQNGIGIGCFTIYRREEKPFTLQHIDLITAFASQAVIAIENTRQFRKLETSNAELTNTLEQQTATSEILQLIASTRTDLEPVLQAVAETACRICDAYDAVITLRDGNWLRLAAHFGPIPFDVDKIPLSSTHSTSRAVLEGRPIHVADILKMVDEYRDAARLAKRTGWRSVLAVPLMTNGNSIGAIGLRRAEPEPFTEKQIQLSQTFAAQAVIAIENVRQFRELQTRLEREAATREILQVISRSRADDVPVFKAILENAQRLCGAPFGNLNMVTEDGTRLEIVADGTEVFEPFRPGWSWPISSRLLVARSVRECAVLQLEDAAVDPLYSEGDKDRVVVVEAGVRSVLTVPLVSNGVGIGSIGLYRREKRPFASDEIDLVQTFAEQAVIAIENVRQFRALEARTEEVQGLNASLEARVEEQVGEIERMGRLKRFLPAAVADTVVSQGTDELLSSHRALLGVLFCDIRGFTAFCETAEPEETIEVLQTYHQEMGKLIADHGAGVDHRMGDGIMVLFNDPLPCEDPAGSAVRLAIAMRAQMSEICRKWKRLGYRLGFGVGISLGYATVGMVGYEGRYDYTASGTAVNLAARLSDLADDGEVLLSPRAYTAVEDDFTAEQRGEVSLKGIREPVQVYRLVEDKIEN
jgi:class 3 adenylate cyclase